MSPASLNGEGKGERATVRRDDAHTETGSWDGGGGAGACTETTACVGGVKTIHRSPPPLKC